MLSQEARYQVSRRMMNTIDRSTDIETAIAGIQEGLGLRAVKIDAMGGWGVELFDDYLDIHMWIKTLESKSQALRLIGMMYLKAAKQTT